MADDVDAVMQTIPAEWRRRWCGAPTCACLGCVQTGNRLVMIGLRANAVDPEYIDESSIPADVFNRFKISKPEWEAWMQRHPLKD